MHEYNDWVYKVINYSKAVLLFVMLTFGFFLVYTITRPPQPDNINASIYIKTAPSDTTTTINGSKFEEGEHSIEPGSYSVEISKPGFKTHSETIEIKAKSDNFIGAVLEPNSKETEDWYNTNSEDKILADGVQSASNDINSANFIKEYPLLKKLPVDGISFKISYGMDNNIPIIYVNSHSTEGRIGAIRWMRYYGYDPSTMNIVFLGTVNPFHELKGQLEILGE